MENPASCMRLITSPIRFLRTQSGLRMVNVRSTAMVFFFMNSKFFSSFKDTDFQIIKQNVGVLFRSHKSQDVVQAFACVFLPQVQERHGFLICIRLIRPARAYVGKKLYALTDQTACASSCQRLFND